MKALRGTWQLQYLFQLIFLLIGRKVFEFPTVVTDALEDLLNKGKIAHMKNRFGQLDMSEMTLTFLALPTS